jgi:hypothetical protein
MMHSAALAALGFALLGEPRSDAVPELSLDIDPCVQVPAERVLAQTALELDVPVVPPSAAHPNATRVHVSCVESHLQLRVADPITGKHLERTLALTTDEVDVAGRMVALAVSELVLTSWMELTLRTPQPATTGFSQPSPEVRRAAQERAELRIEPVARVRYVQALAQIVGPFQRVGAGFGGGLRLGWSSSRGWLGGDLDLIASRADADEPLGKIRVSTWSAGLRVAFRLHLDRFWLDAGSGGRFGLARLDGSASDPSQTRGVTLAGTWAGPVVYLGAGVRVWHCVIAVGAEAGYVLRSVSGQVEGGSPVSIDGAWVAGSVGLGWGQ